MFDERPPERTKAVVVVVVWAPQTLLVRVPGWGCSLVIVAPVVRMKVGRWGRRIILAGIFRSMPVIEVLPTDAHFV